MTPERIDIMHPFSRLGCRLFQFAFRAALPILPYRQPKLLGSLLKKLVRPKDRD